MGYEFWPEALEATLRYTNQVAGVPIIVTENGIDTADDTRRLEYYRRALQGVVNCLNPEISQHILKRDGYVRQVTVHTSAGLQS
jgi:beta-glucosidase